MPETQNACSCHRRTIYSYLLNDSAPSELLRKMIADVEKCLCADRDRAGVAFQTLPTNIKTDEGVFTPRGVMNMTFKIKYNQKYGDPKNEG